MKTYGKELIIDIHNCDFSTFTRKSIKNFFEQLCEKIDMVTDTLYWWDDYGLDTKYHQTEPHTKGTTAVQFILTSNIIIHTLDLLENVYINVFSCKDFDESIAIQFSEDWFKGKVVNSQVIERL